MQAEMCRLDYGSSDPLLKATKAAKAAKIPMRAPTSALFPEEQIFQGLEVGAEQNCFMRPC